MARFVEVSDLKSALKALEMLDKKPPLNLKVSLAQPKDAYARKQEIIQVSFGDEPIKSNFCLHVHQS